MDAIHVEGLTLLPRPQQLKDTLNHSLAGCTSAPMVSPRSPVIRGRNCELSEEDRTALALQHACWALPSGKERLPAGLEPMLGAAFGVARCYPRIVWTNTKERMNRGQTVSEISTTIPTADGFYIPKTGQSSGNCWEHSHVDLGQTFFQASRGCPRRRQPEPSQLSRARGSNQGPEARDSHVFWLVLHLKNRVDSSWSRSAAIARDLRLTSIRWTWTKRCWIGSRWTRRYERSRKRTRWAK